MVDIGGLVVVHSDQTAPSSIPLAKCAGCVQDCLPFCSDSMMHAGDTREAAAALAKSCTLNLSSCYLNQVGPP